jgi:hypothetical protein
MAFSIPAKYKEEISIKGKSQEELMKLALEAAEAMKWSVKDVTSNGFYVSSEFSIVSLYEIIQVTTNNEVISIKSRSAGLQMFDRGKNKKNVAMFKAQLNYLIKPK